MLHGTVGEKTSAMVEVTHGSMQTTVLSDVKEIPSLPSEEKKSQL